MAEGKGLRVIYISLELYRKESSGAGSVRIAVLCCLLPGRTFQLNSNTGAKDRLQTAEIMNTWDLGGLRQYSRIHHSAEERAMQRQECGRRARRMKGM